MNPFEKHGIKHLSPSSLQLHSAEPGLWCMRYLLKIKDEGVGPGAWRGNAVEDGLKSWLYKRDIEAAKESTHNRFEMDAMGESAEHIDKERAALDPMLEQAIEAFADFPSPVATQLRCEHWVEGVEVPIIGYLDFLFENCVVDLKTTLRCPSEPKPDHARQVSLYSLAKGVPGRLIYVTPKKFAPYPVPYPQKYMLDLARSAHAVRHLLSKTQDGKDAARLYSPNFDNFYWSKDTLQKAKDIWNVHA